MEMKVGLTYSCMNLKKLARIKHQLGLPSPDLGPFFEQVFENLKWNDKMTLGLVP